MASPTIQDVMTRVNALSTNFDRHCEEEKIAREADRVAHNNLMGVLVGTPHKPGLAERIRRLEEFADELRAVRRWMILGVVGLVGKLAWEIFVWASTHSQ